MKTIKLVNGMETIVDDQDYEELSKHNWYFNNKYATRHSKDSKKKGAIYMHKSLLQKEGCVTDHINGDKLDNRRENLRTCTPSQNAANRHYSIGKSGYKGVYWHKPTQRYIAGITINYKLKYLGYFDTKEEAAMAYNEAATKFFGEFANLNKII